MSEVGEVGPLASGQFMGHSGLVQLTLKPPILDGAFQGVSPNWCG